MSEEEAIKYLSNNLKDWKECKPNYSPTEIVEEVDKDYQAIEIILNLIEKQQKEIEELKEDNNYQWEERCKLTFELEDSVNKDKIKELQDKYKNKIEKLESKKIWNEPVDTIKKNRYINYYNAYEELLGE